MLFICSQVFLVYCKRNANTGIRCEFNLDTTSPVYPPHLIDANLKIVMPVLEGTTRVINLDEGEQVTVSCLGMGNFLQKTGYQRNPATCTANSKLKLQDGTELSYGQLGCLKQNRGVLVERGSCANGPGTLIRNGWEFGNEFLPLYDMCHDKNLALNYYSVNVVSGRSANAGDKSNKRPPFSQDIYFPGINVSVAYTQKQQTKTIAKILGSEQLAAEYIKPNSQYFLSRGHMSPNGDFIDAASQDASFYFTNTAPQFQTFNGGNWRLLENGIRSEALSRQLDLTVYTGTFSVMTLADINNVQQPIYLAFDENNNGLIPAPKYYWKLIHDPISNTATAVIGINNPYLNPVKEEDIICPNVCDQVPWVNEAIVALTDIKKGYTFCCTAADLHKAISYAPDINVPLFGSAATKISTIDIVTLACLCIYGYLYQRN
ncbi:hypothetical protein GHT06_022844 [Daphnia sinensis]|uniref:DNA/RNA non-specific endonuclease/pyrophosphatase/phosphodiesterase domain-containing protein n=1 Tax=Daphnia sinensis TaxID=1820382 RepID=A0AAD5PP17_9CRUS|nr:hypothetical protein GHT06_022844 [Daphnia sinensis]